MQYEIIIQGDDIFHHTTIIKAASLQDALNSAIKLVESLQKLTIEKLIAIKVEEL